MVEGVRVVRDGLPDAARAVRRDVFVAGQGVPESRELDGKDADATHFLAEDAGEAVGTARLRVLDGGDRGTFVEPEAVFAAGAPVGKVERVAVRAARRGEGWGRRLMAAVERAARERGCETVALHGQTRVEDFYERLGYRTVSDVFADADMPHVEMVKRVSEAGVTLGSRQTEGDDTRRES
ncbi:MAG: GNAT family N-acetyltransferase [Halorientalis sp.]